MSRVFDCIQKRRSVRKYKDADISDCIIKKIITSGLYAPSGKNRKPWRFAVIRDPADIRLLANLTIYSRFMKKAPVVVLLFAKTDDAYPVEKDMISVGACVQNILLSAYDNGYGSCVVGELYNKQEDIYNLINLDCRNLLLVLGIALGRREGECSESFKFNLDDFILNKSN